MKMHNVLSMDTPTSVPADTRKGETDSTVQVKFNVQFKRLFSQYELENNKHSTRNHRLIILGFLVFFRPSQNRGQTSLRY